MHVPTNMGYSAARYWQFIRTSCAVGRDATFGAAVQVCGQLVVALCYGKLHVVHRGSAHVRAAVKLQ